MLSWLTTAPKIPVPKKPRDQNAWARFIIRYPSLFSTLSASKFNTTSMAPTASPPNNTLKKNSTGVLAKAAPTYDIAIIAMPAIITNLTG